MEGNSGNKKDGYESDSEYESALEDQEGVKKAATNLMRRSSELSLQGQSVIGDFAESMLSQFGIYQTPSNRPIYDVPRTENNASRNDTSPSLPSSLPPSTLSRRHSSDSGISSGAESGFQQCFDNGKKRLSSINESEMSDAVNRAVEVVSSPEVQEQLENKIKSDPSFLKKMQEKWNSLGNKDKSLFGLGTFGIAIGAPIAIVALPILATVAAVAGLAVAIIGGLKLATPSKAEFKKFGQEIKHSVKNAIDKVPIVQEKDSNIKKLFYDSDVTQDHRDFIREYIVKNDGSKDQLKVDDNKIEAFKKAALTIGVNIDIKALSEKGKSTFDSDYEKFKTQITAIDKDVLESPEMKETFKDKLTEIKQPEELRKVMKEVDKEAKKVDKAIGKGGSFGSSFSKSSSHAEDVEAKRRESNSSQGMER